MQMRCGYGSDHDDEVSQPSQVQHLCQVCERVGFSGLLDTRHIISKTSAVLCTLQSIQFTLTTTTTGVSAGLTMWQWWQMPRASGLGGPTEVENKIFQPVGSQVI